MSMTLPPGPAVRPGFCCSIGRADDRSGRLHAVPIQTSAMIHIPVRAGGGKKSAATMASFGIHHANAFVRGLLSQSGELLDYVVCHDGYVAQREAAPVS